MEDLYANPRLKFPLLISGITDEILIVTSKLKEKLTGKREEIGSINRGDGG